MRRPLVAFLVGLILAFGLQWLKAETFAGNWAGLLAVGRESDLAPVISSELTDLPLWDGVGHDGQISYAIGRDPLGNELASLIDNPGYRYRRLLYPLLAGLGSSLPPRATLAGLVVLAAVGTGLGAAAISMLASAWRLPAWLPAVLLINPGMWLSVQLLTSDSLALGLTLLGIGLVVKGRAFTGTVMLGLSSLSKEFYLLSALAVAFGLRKGETAGQRIRILLVAAMPLGAWALYTAVRFGGDAHGNIGLPFRGLVTALQSAWPALPPHELIYLVVGLAGWLLAAVGVVVAKEPLLKLLCGMYAVLGAVASHFVWDLGNNAARTLLPAGVFGMIALISATRSDRAGVAAQTNSLRNLPV